MGETPSDVEKVWTHYQTVIPGASRQALDAVKRRVIENALKSRDVAKCCEAINGLAASPHHNGENEQRTKYLGIRYALKGNSAKGEGNDERIDKMAEIAPSAAGELLAGIPSAGREMVRHRQRLVEEALLNPGDATRCARAGDSQSYLEQAFGLVAHTTEGASGDVVVAWARRRP